MNVQYLRQFLADNKDLGDLILARTALRELAAGYENINLEVPEWIGDKFRVVQKEIEAQRDGLLERELRNAENQLAALATPAERKKSLQEQITKLKETLNK